MMPGSTGPWFLRDEHCRLIPGDSPLGYRLPLDSQPWVGELDYPYVTPQDPHQPFPPLPSRQSIQQQLRTPLAPGQWPRQAGRGRGAGRAGAVRVGQRRVRTALCAEPRDGRLYLFMPPLNRLDDYLELVAAIEATAARAALPGAAGEATSRRPTRA